MTPALECISLLPNITLSFSLQGQCRRQSQKNIALPSYLHHHLTLSIPASTLASLDFPSQQKVAIRTFPPMKLLPQGFQRMKKELWLRGELRIQVTADQARDRNYRSRCIEPCRLLLLVSDDLVIGLSGLPAHYSPEEARKSHQGQSQEIKQRYGRYTNLLDMGSLKVQDTEEAATSDATSQSHLSISPQALLQRVPCSRPYVPQPDSIHS